MNYHVCLYTTVLLVSTGCQSDFIKASSLTHSLYFRNNRYKSYIREIAPTAIVGKNEKIGSSLIPNGGYTGTITRNGKEFYEFQFAKILNGDGRVFSVLIAQRDKRIILTEEGERKPFLRSAILLPHYNKTLKRIRESGAAAKLKLAGDSRYPGALLQLIADEHKVGLRMLLEEPGRGGKRVSRRFFYEVLRPPKIEELRWVERSRLIYALRHAGYIATVPADIVLIPFTFVCLWPWARGLR